MDRFTTDEIILLRLQETSCTSAQLSIHLNVPQRSIRRRLRRLITDGYVFSPERGRYRIAAAGVRAMEPIPASPGDSELERRRR